MAVDQRLHLAAGRWPSREERDRRARVRQALAGSATHADALGGPGTNPNLADDHAKTTRRHSRRLAKRELRTAGRAANSGAPSAIATLANVSYTGTINGAGGTGAYKKATGKGTLKCSRP